MTHCTVCGAAAREGAKFCTSCGARLVDTTYAAPATAETTSEQEAITTVPAEAAESDRPAGEPEATQVSPGTGDEPATEAPLETEPAPEVLAEIEPAPESPEYVASWPAENETAAAEEPATEADAVAEPASPWSTWSSDEGATTVTGPAPETFATDADQDLQAEPAVGTDAASAPEADEVVEVSHHGASDWESWAPVASGESAVAPHAASGEGQGALEHSGHPADVAASVRQLLDDLANRIDRMIAPVTLASRDVDADTLADQLERWSRPAQGSADLLAVVQGVRKAPRDLDAIRQLADRAADLELLVRHYQAITAGAGEWARELRARKTSSSEG